ncbi:hypothetical protein [Burkholderia gladioli]|uniref:hypothetical protein n=1 Tax=Burkholderia gladioli TaxID=28095 RepID=UPI0020300AEB|nr:hypothetical protein [Burkholderia gladioli]URV24874.1 hypothetical protein NAL90_00025 [Burkholderia gladioli]
MKLVQTEYLIRSGSLAASAEGAAIVNEIEAGITEVVWPPGANAFNINPTRKGNGVDPIKENFLAHLASTGWRTEVRMGIGAIRPGPLDAVKALNDGRHFAVEWETGNIASSHRAINKMIMGMQCGQLGGGALVLPTRELYRYLTDRIGNFEEISPYFGWFRSCAHVEGLLAVFAIQHDAESSDVPLIPKRTDGWRNFRAELSAQ